MTRFFLTIFLLMAMAPFASAQDVSSGYTETYQQEALEIYRKSISIRSALGHGKVPEVADYLAGKLLQGGFDKNDVTVLPFTLANGEQSAGLVVRYRGDGSSGKEPILLLAHMDIVDALPEDWERDPFTLIEEDGYFFGRGSLDNKFGTTMLTATFLRLKAEGFVPTRDLIIAFTGDEETVMVTTQAMFTTHRDLTDAEFVLNADAGGGVLDSNNKATSYLVQAAEKTYATFELTVRNPGGHSSRPRSDNAIFELADALKKIQAYRFPIRTNDITREYFSASAKVTEGELGAAMQRFADYPLDEEAANILYADPSQVGITRTTCVATMLRAGHAENALPQSATATINCRIFPGVAVDEVAAKLVEVSENSSIEIAVLNEPTASPASALREDVMFAVARAVHATHPDIPIIPYMAAYGTDGKWTRIAGMPTYGVSGLLIQPKDKFSHGLNERAPVRSFYSALEHWHILLTELAGR